MTAKDDLIVYGVVGTVLLGGIYIVTRGIGGLIPDFSKWLPEVPKFTLPDLSGLGVQEPVIDPTGVLQTWYADAINQINDLNKRITDMTNEAITNAPKVIVSPGIYKVPDAFDKEIDRSIEATKKITDAVKSGVNVAEVVKEEIKKVVAWQVPGWMPKGEV